MNIAHIPADGFDDAAFDKIGKGAFADLRFECFFVNRSVILARVDSDLIIFQQFEKFVLRRNHLLDKVL